MSGLPYQAGIGHHTNTTQRPAVAPPLHYTRGIPADDNYAVGTWMLEKLEK
ncbi:hypothetical protein AB0C34_15690 [Nocardia sp. NPDC049220]|uniref:hypothetical protein n=1 Tax=Nocardia sp. NPDC049220 TaxID=3155273 RepID=UPI00340D430C